MGSEEFIERCKELVANYFNHKLRAQGKERLSSKEVYVVWSVKVLQNNKALLSTPVPDGKYYELTYNGDKKEIYLDVYSKYENIKYENIITFD